MIYVDRSKVPVPGVLQSALAAEARARIAELLTKSDARYLEQLRINFERPIWNNCIPDLLKLFNNKCAYCESPLTGQPGDVEHFRPKQGAEDLNGERRHLYYAWLAYEWDNLLIACANCNRRRTVQGQRVGKADLFPVEGKRAELLADVAECRQTEIPLLIDPCHIDPANHLAFEESGLVTARSPQGQATIDILGLNLRTELVKERKSEWSRFRISVTPVLKGLELPRMYEHIQVERLASSLDPTRPYFAVRLAAFRKYRAELELPSTESFQNALANIHPSLALPLWSGVDAPVPPASPAPSAQPPKQTVPKKQLPHFHFERIRRIEIRNFKAIESLDLDIPPGPPDQTVSPGALMMLGENATGKSSVLDAVALALLGTRQIAALKLDGKSFLRRASMIRDDVPPEFPASVIVKLDDAASVIRLDIALDGTFSGNEEPAVVLLGYGPRRFFWQGAKHVDAPAERIKSMFDPLATLANPQEWLLTCSDDNFAYAVRALRDMLLLREDAFVKREPEFGMPKTHVVFELEGREEELGTLSEGYKTVVAMGVDIMREMLGYWNDLEQARGVVLIDELDTHLHPRWKMRIAQRLRKALPAVQFIASTHDPLCLRGYYDGEVQVLRRGMEGGIERVIGLPNVRGLSVQQLLTSEFFGLYSAEDPALEGSVASYATLAMKRDRTSAEEEELTRQRAATDATLQVGTDETDRVMHAALTEYVREKRTVPQEQKAKLERETVMKLVDLFKAADEQDKLTP